MVVIRYVLPITLIALGVLALPLDPRGIGVELFAMLVGAGLSVWFMNLLFRAGAKGDRERDDEEAARDYFSQHGHWPDEAPQGSESQDRH